MPFWISWLLVGNPNISVISLGVITSGNSSSNAIRLVIFLAILAILLSNVLTPDSLVYLSIIVSKPCLLNLCVSRADLCAPCHAYL